MIGGNEIPECFISAYENLPLTELSLKHGLFDLPRETLFEDDEAEEEEEEDEDAARMEVPQPSVKFLRDYCVLDRYHHLGTWSIPPYFHRRKQR